jgi:SAM-dependent methyltransferase
MPTLDWLKKEFNYGYDSGNILSLIPNSTRCKEEKAIGGSYRKVFLKAAVPYIKPNSVILELGPGRGSWSRAILKYIPDGQLHTLDFQDVTKWLNPEKYNGRLICHKTDNNSLYSSFEDNYFDFFWSFGVLCHNNIEQIEEILRNILPKMKPGGIAVHMYADWDKLDKYGWEKGRVPLEFRDKPDNEIWWPRNNQKVMSSLSSKLGWIVITSDLGLVKRDSIIVLQRK